MSRYVSSRNQMVQGEDITPVAAGARTATFTGSAVPCDEFGTAVLTLGVTAASGTTPTLNVTIETTHDGTNWVSVGTFAQKTTVSSETKAFTGLGQSIRAVNTIAGTTPSFTFSITGLVK